MFTFSILTGITAMNVPEYTKPAINIVSAGFIFKVPTCAKVNSTIQPEALSA